MNDFKDFVLRATGGDHGPYPWQQTIADGGLPDVISVETGCGKTEGVLLPWLWRRRYHLDPAVRLVTPHWLVLCLPLRVLTSQVEDLAHGLLRNLDIEDDVAVHVVMGGRAEGTGQSLRRNPHTDAVVIGTVDMLVSRALNRGYAMGRFSWPIDFGLLHNGCHWVFDEVQLLGPALPTSRQLDAFRREFGTTLPTATTWMSATLDEEAMRTIDAPELDTVVRLNQTDHQSSLRKRLDASRVVRRVAVDPKRRNKELASFLLDAHRPGTLTLAIVNTVKTARSLWSELCKISTEMPTLLHSRFRPDDRRERLGEALGPLPPGGRIVVATQLIEAGVDISATTMLIEAASWPSVVQRAGRCNRDGEATDAALYWVQPESPAPYEEQDVTTAMAALDELEGRLVTATSLRELPVATSKAMHAVLRRTDLLGLFDTAPDLSGNDVDVAPYIRPVDGLDVQVAWRELPDGRPSTTDASVSAEELCPVPLGRELSEFIAQAKPWYFDHLAGSWRPAQFARHRPGMVIIADAKSGGYDPHVGWNPNSRVPVEPVPLPTLDEDDPDPEQSIGADPRSYTGVWVQLERHLKDVESTATMLIEALGADGFGDTVRQAIQAAARLHDVGKAHPTFQETLLKSADSDDEQSEARAKLPWAKSGGSKRARHARPNFRHELASALMLLGDASIALEGIADCELVTYLVAAHHGRIRMGIRSPADETSGSVLGIEEGDQIPAVQVPGGSLPASTLSLDVATMGRTPAGGQSWTAMAARLLDRYGPFRLAYFEAMVRLADWRASDAEAGESSDL